MGCAASEPAAAVEEEPTIRSVPTSEMASGARAVRVVVIGAGTSGLAAARTLVDTWDSSKNGGPLELTVLEARNRIGGRTWTLVSEAPAAWNAADALGAPTDMGASWIHGSCPEHPITKIATALGQTEGGGLVQTDDDSSEVVLCDTGKTPDDDKFDAYESMLEQAQDKAEDAETDKSIWQMLSGRSESGQTRDSALFQYHLATGAEFNTAGPASQLSAWSGFDDEEYEGSEVVWAKGYKTMYEALQSGAVKLNDGSNKVKVTAVAPGSRKPLAVQYGKRIREVAYDESGVKLTNADDGLVYRADYAIITIPLGVLKSSDPRSAVTFRPDLPRVTAEGIRALGFGNVVKVALLFPTVWWPEGTHYYGLAQAGEPDRGLFTYFLNVHALSDKPVLMTFALGSAADMAEKMSDAAVWEAIRTNLMTIFDSNDDVTVPEEMPHMIRSEWRADPHAKGAYTYCAVGTSKDTISAAFGGAVEGRLFFAGEHTSAAYRGTVHGAFQTGQQAARAVVANSRGAPAADSEEEEDD
jgi:polyamine oxidase